MKLGFVILLGLTLTVSAQGPIGPISGGAKGLQSFAFQNGNGFSGNTTNNNGAVTLSLQLNSGAVSLPQIVTIPTQSILARKTAGTGTIETIASTDLLDFIGATRGDILYRGASGWTVLAPGTATNILTSGGAGADPSWSADVNEKTAHKAQVNGYASLDGTTHIPIAQIPTGVELTTNKGANSGYAPLNSSGLVPITNLGTGGTGGGTKALFDDGIYHSVTGGGSVLDVAVATAHGVSAVSDHDATTPSLTFTLAAITPTTIVASSTISGSNLSGTNTGDQTITLTGDVTGTGTGSFAATVANSAITYAKIQNVAANSLLGNSTGSGAAPLEIGLGGGMSFSGGKLRAFNSTQALVAYAMDAAVNKSFRKQLIAGANNFTWSNLADGDTIMLRCIQVASGSVGTVVLPALGADGAHTTYWKGGSQPVQTATVNKTDRYICQDDGGDMFCFADQNY